MVSTDKFEIKIISTYNPPNKKIQRDDINELFKDNPIILLGDLNSKNEIWGCLKTNPNVPPRTTNSATTIVVCRGGSANE
ncbi:hypothetical protein QTP88_011793 [Uroleucon formosanum]